MLSRVAHSLYWMARYIERAENIARLVDVNLQLLLDLRELNEKKLAAYWLPIVQATGDEKDFGRFFGETIDGVKIVSPKMLAEELTRLGLL